MLWTGRMDISADKHWTDETMPKTIILSAYWRGIKTVIDAWKQIGAAHV